MKRCQKFKEYDVEEEIDALCSLGKSFVFTYTNRKIMQLLYEEGMIIGDIAKKTGSCLPPARRFHLKIPGGSGTDPHGKAAGNERKL